MNEQKNKLEIIKKRCATSSKVVGVIRIITIVGIVLSVVGAIVCFTKRDMVDSFFSEAVKSGNITVDNLQIGNGGLKLIINYQDAIAAGNYAVPMTFNCIVSAIICLVVTLILSILTKTCSDWAKEETPVAETILKRLRTMFIIIAFLLAIYAGIGPCVVGALLLWCIYSIMEYGAALQTEVDEML